jgi:hypothetical protein
MGVRPALAAGAHTIAINGRSVTGSQLTLGLLRILSFRIHDVAYAPPEVTANRWRPTSLIEIRVA